MLNSYSRIIYVLLLCSRHAISFTRLPSAGFHLFPLQQAAIKYQNPFSTDLSSSPSQLDFNKSSTSYTGLLVHYLVQNERPKFHLCVNVISKIVEREGADTAIRTAESLQNNISAESFRMTKNALLSALVLQKQTAAAASHLRRLLLQQNGHWQLDAAVVADLLQLYMAANSDRDTTTLRREYKKRALEAALLYSDVMGQQPLFQSQSSSQVLWKGQGQERGYPTSALASVSASAAAIDRIHEYGARAFAVSREWDRAVAAVTCIGERHLASESLSLFSSKLLDRIVILVSKSRQSDLSDKDSRAVYASLALKLSLLQPLHLLPLDSPLLGECLLQLSASPRHLETVIRSLEEVGVRRGAVSVGSAGGLGTVSLAEGLSEGVTAQLVGQLFFSGCSANQLVEAITLLWGQTSGDYGNSNSSDGGRAVSLRGVGAPSDTLGVIQRILDIACSLRDGSRGDLGDIYRDSGAAGLPLRISEGVAALPSLVHRALSPHATGDGLSGALNPSLLVLLLALRAAGVQDMASSTLQAIADFPSGAHSDPCLSVWRPDMPLLQEVLCLNSRDGAADPLAVFREVTMRVRTGVVPDAYVLSFLFRAAIPSPSFDPAIEAAAWALWAAMVEGDLTLCHTEGPVLSAALAFSFSHQDPSRGIQVCKDAVTVATSASPPFSTDADRALCLNSAVRAVLTTLQREGIAANSVPRALLSLVKEQEGVTGGQRGGGVDLNTLQLGALISLGGTGRGAGREGGGSEGCTYKYSSLLHLSLYLSSIEPDQLSRLLPSLLRLGDEWPKIILKSFAHLHRSAGSHDDSAVQERETSSYDRLVVQAILESFDRYLCGALDACSMAETASSTLLGAFGKYSETASDVRDASGTILSSDTLAAAVDLCSSAKPLDAGRGAEEQLQARFSQCKLYYSIGWLAAERAMPPLPSSSPSPSDDSSRRRLGLSLNQLSFALLKAAKRLTRPSSEAIQTVRQKMEFFLRMMPGSLSHNMSDNMSSPQVADTEESSEEEGATLTMTQVAAAAVTYRETRLLSSIASSRGGGDKEELMSFWATAMTSQPSLLGYSTAVFELLDAHMGAGNGTGVLLWARSAVDSGTVLPPLRVKELLARYTDSPSLHCLPALLPLFAKLCGVQPEFDFDGRGEEEAGERQPPIWHKRSGGSDLSLPLSMAVLRDLCVQLLTQRRLSDASVLLKSVHPLQWPYDELLFALATGTESGTDTARNERGSEGRRRECVAVLRRREELSVPAGPIKSSTAKSLLAMPAPSRDPTDGEGSADSEQEFRMMVARAVKLVVPQGAEVLNDRSVPIGADNNNGRILISGNANNAVSESDVRSGLLALLTLYSLTDTVSDKPLALNVSVAAVESPPLQPSPPGPRSSGWVDPESPENLLKFLSDIEGLGSGRGTKTGVSGGDKSQAALEATSGVDGDRGARSVGLRVSGSKKSWKRGGTYGLSFDKSSLPARTQDETLVIELESADVLVCGELAGSLLDTVVSQIATHKRDEEELEIELELEVELRQLRSNREKGGGDRRGERRRGRRAEDRSHTSIIGATRELFSLDNQQQADRLFSTFPQSEALCANLLLLSSLRADSSSAALVLQQMGYRDILLKGAKGDGDTWRRIHRVMVGSAHTPHSGESASQVWGDLKRIFSAVRPALLRQLQAPLSGPEEPPREMLVDMLELGALSYLRSLQEGEEESGEIISEEEQRAREQEQEHWLREGERQKGKDRLAAERLQSLDALSASRELTLELMQQFPHLSVPLSDSFGSELMSAFLFSGDVDSSLAILNILLRSGGHASDAACELLAKKLLSKGRHSMARAICRLMHSRGRICDSSLYDFLFASMLAPSPSEGPPLPLPPLTSTRQDMRDIGMWGAEGRAAGTGPLLQRGTKDMLAAVTDALQLLEEISAATSTTSAVTGPGPADSVLTSTGSKEVRFRKVANTLMDILVKFGYSDACLELVQTSISRLKRSRMG